MLKPQANHPEEGDREFYYNTQEECYYRSEWREKNPEQPQSKSGYIWIGANGQYIIDHTRYCEELQAHFRMFHNIHKGQLCVFKGYAIDPNGEFKKPSTVESKLILDDRTKWFYNPWSFEVSLLNEDTIGDFVEGTPISEEMAKKMVRYHKIERKTQKRAKTREWGRNSLNKISKFVQSVEKYPTWSVAIISAIVTFFLSNIGTILKWFLKQSGG